MPALSPTPAFPTAGTLNPEYTGVNARAQTRVRLMLAMLVLIVGSLALRLWGIGWGIPNYDPATMPNTPYRQSYHIDEDNFFWGLMQMKPSELNFDVGDYHWGTLQFYLVYGAALSASAIGAVPSPWESSFIDGDTTALPRLYIAGRLVSVIAGVFAVCMVAMLGAALVGARAGFAAGVAYAIAPLPVVEAHYLTNDITASALIAASVLCAVLAVQRMGLRLLYFSALLLGLAIAAKYSAAFALPGLVVAQAAIFLSRKDVSLRTRIMKLGILPWVLVIAGFLLAEPYAVVPGKLTTGIAETTTGNLVDLQLGLQAILEAFVWQIRSLAAFGLTWPLAIVALAGVILMSVRAFRALRHNSAKSDAEPTTTPRFSGELVLLAAVAGITLSLLLNKIEVVRYTQPLIPLLAVAAGVAWGALPKLWQRSIVAVPIVLAAGIITLGQLSILSETHTANNLLAWLQSNLKPGQEVARLWPEYSALDQTRYTLTRLDPWRPDLPAGSHPDYIILDDMELGQPTQQFSDLLASSYTPVATFSAQPHIGPFYWSEASTPHDWKYSHPSFVVYARR